MLKTVLRGCLTKQQRDEGLYLVEADDHSIELRDKGGKLLAVWSSGGATVAEVRKEADQHIGEFDIDKALDEISVPAGDITKLREPNEREKLLQELAAWIDTYVIADMIIGHLEEQGEALTLDRAKEVWCRTLENLSGGVGLAR